MGHPSIYPSGTTIFNSKKAYSGYTIFQAKGKGAMLIDMNGKEVHLWKDLDGFPNKILPGGYVMGSLGERSGKYGMQDQLDLVQVDWDGNVVWSFDKWEFIEDPEKTPRWMARQHHDYQREGSSTGYYSPEQTPNAKGGKTLILSHKNVYNHRISDKNLLDDVILEVDWDGNILWQWHFNEHFDELGFDQAARNVLFRDPNMRTAGGGMGDWLHINSLSYLGENPFYDAGDERFHPDNVIWDAREANIIGITSRKTGQIVWQIGPDYSTPTLKHLGWIIGQHHAHMIPKGLPGAGNILVFDNGGWAGYGLPNPSSAFGIKNAWRDSSRILEINPVTLEIVWKYTAQEDGFGVPMDASRFYSPYISSAQRLPNGNTLITQGSDGRLLEVTAEHEIVWEYISPYWKETPVRTNMVYRAYRVPYSWVPQLETPQEIDILPLDVTKFRLPNAAAKDTLTGTTVEGVVPNEDDGENVLCIASQSEEDALSSEKLFSIDKELFAPIVKTAAKTVSSIQIPEGKVLLLFGAERCGNCKALHAKLEKQLKDVNYPIFYIDTDQNPDLCEEFSIMGIPVVVAIQNRKEVDRFAGDQSESFIQDFIQKFEA